VCSAATFSNSKEDIVRDIFNLIISARLPDTLDDIEIKVISACNVAQAYVAAWNQMFSNENRATSTSENNCSECLATS